MGVCHGLAYLPGAREAARFGIQGADSSRPSRRGGTAWLRSGIVSISVHPSHSEALAQSSFTSNSASGWRKREGGREGRRLGHQPMPARPGVGVAVCSPAVPLSTQPGQPPSLVAKQQSFASHQHRPSSAASRPNLGRATSDDLRRALSPSLLFL